MTSYKHLILRVLCDALFCFLAYLPWIIIKSTASPFKRGFFCDDESLRHPYFDSTVSSSVMVSLSLIVPLATILITEGVRYCYFKEKGESSRSLVVRTAPSHIEFHPTIISIYKSAVIFIFGAAALESFTNIGKYGIGRLRPHFFYICKPDYTKFNCTDEHGFQRYVTEDVCMGTDEHRLEEMRLSFPSGHASLSVYAAVFFTMYLQSRMTWKGSKLIKHFLQTVAIWLALYTCITRISDYKHHWSDVLGGILLGAVIAYLMCLYGSSLFKSTPGLVCTANNPSAANVTTSNDVLVNPPNASQQNVPTYKSVEQHSL